MLAVARLSAVVLALIAVVAPRPASAVATISTANDLCSPASDPCVVSTNYNVPPNTTLDFGPRTLDVKSSGGLNVNGGSLTIVAGNVRLEAGAALTGAVVGTASPTITIHSTGFIRLEATASVKSKIDVSDANSAGEIDLYAGGDIQIDGNLFAKGTATYGVGGTVNILGICQDGALMGSSCDSDVPGCGDLVSHGTCGSGNHNITGSLRASGVDEGGEVYMATAQGSATVGGSGIDASGGEDGGGDVEVDAFGGITTSGTITVNGGGLSGDAGTVSLISTGPLVVGAPITGQAGGSLTEGGGTGADVELTSYASSVRVNALIDADSGSPDGSAGSIDINAGTDYIQSPSALLSLAGRGPDASGGYLTPTVSGNLTIGPVDVSGANGGAGSIDAGAGLNTTIQADINGDGGADVSFQTGGTLLVNATLHADAYQDQIGGFIMLIACDLTVPVGHTVSADGPTGEVVLQAAGHMTIAGSVTSTQNEFDYLAAANAPVVTGSVVPPATLVVKPDLPPCGIPPAICGNGTIEDGEQCDDDNNVACDGCSPTCQLEGCGNGIVECGEECDDGPANGTPNDPCSAACKLVGGIRYIPGSHTGSTGCFLEWAVINPNSPLTKGFPSTTQRCIDGDPACDADGANDGQCTFQTGVCLNRDDTRLPLCDPNAISKITMLTPNPLNPSDLTDSYNTSVLFPLVRAFGTNVYSSTTPLVITNTPDPRDNDCSALGLLHVPHPAGVSATRAFRLSAKDEKNHSMDNRIVLGCDPNPAVCGNGILELGEQCDDGNTVSCDGCSSTCRIECGDGVVDCGEQCDDGKANGTPGDNCSAACQEVPPALRIPGGGSAKLDCGLEWSVALAQPVLLRTGVARNKQFCIDNDPSCDSDPAVGNCHFKVWACLGADDARLACPAAAVSSVDVLRPTLKEPPANLAARTALEAQLARLGAAGPGETCTGRIDVDVPLGKKYFIFKSRAHIGPKTDTDVLQLGCFPPPA